MEIIGWRGIFVGLAAAILATAAAIFLLSPEPAPREHRVQPTLRSLVEVYRNAAFRRTVFIVLVPHTAYFGVQSLWMGSWLHDVVGYSPRMIAGYLFAGMTAMVIGTIAAGHITQYASKRGYTTLDVAAIGLLIFAFVQLSIVLDIKWMRPTAAILFPLFGAFAGLEFTIVAQSVPAAMTGRAATCLNLLIFTGSFCVQAGFGVMLGLWPHDTHGVYPAEAYQAGFGVLLFLQLPGLLWWLLDLLRRQNITPQTTPTECNPS